MIAPTRDDLNTAWAEYRDATRLLAQMRDPESQYSKIDCERQLDECERLLENWMAMSYRVSMTLD